MRVLLLYRNAYTKYYALAQPGRFDRQIYVAPPNEAARSDILRIGLKDVPTDPDLDLDEIAKRTSGYSGAETMALCREAAMAALVHACVFCFLSGLL